MDNDDDDFDFADDFFGEENEPENEFNSGNVEFHPLHKLATEIFQTVDAIIAHTRRSDYAFLQEDIHRSADLMIIKIEEAMSNQSWMNAMQCAALIRHEAIMLQARTGLLEYCLDSDKNYVRVLREELTRFRTLFNDWVMEIQDFDDEVNGDDWGLFVRERFE